MPDRTDTERIDWMEELLVRDIWGQLQYGRYIGKWTMQILPRGEKMRDYIRLTARQAIDAAMDKEQGDG